VATVAEQDQLAQAHIAGQQQIRSFAAAAVAGAWTALPHHDESNVPTFLNTVVPVVAAAQRASVTLTEAYLARSIGRQPVGVNIDDLIGSAVRNGTPPSEVYRRPFVTVWSALKDGKPYTDAVHAGLARATTAAETDVQLSMRQTLTAVGQSDRVILGYRRIPDATACEFCRLVAGQRYRTDQLMPIHPHCGCSVGVITAENRHEFHGNPKNDLSVIGDGVNAAVVQHGELGPLLVDGTQKFTSEADIAALAH
jgi:hypothetical protein